jgi:predicted acylesterase/phospholipase RssA
MKVRIALTVPGVVALGAFEAGALAAVLSAVQDHCEGDDPAVRVDVIAGASSGSLTAVLAARCLLDGLDPADALYHAWVTQASAKALMRGGLQAPLSQRALRRLAAAMLAPATGDGRPRQSVPVRISAALGNLRGLAYQLGGVHDPAMHAVSYLDWGDITIKPGQDLTTPTSAEDTSALDLVLASASNPLGFGPRLVSRAEDEDRYVSLGVRNFPPSKKFWYTDGAIVDRQPLGRALAIANELDADALDDVHRVHIVIDPQPPEASAGDLWADPAAPPTWTSTLRRCVDVLQTQAVYDDMRQVEQTNDQLRWLELLCDRLRPTMQELPGPAVDALRAAFEETLAEIERAPGDAAARPPRRAVERAAGSRSGPPDPVDLLRDVVERVADLTGKSQIHLEVISPMAISKAEGTSGPALSGAFLFRFGGLLDKSLRQSDFAIGYQSALTWLRESVLAHHRTGWSFPAVRLNTRPATAGEPDQRGRTRTPLSFRARLTLAWLLLRVLLVLIVDRITTRWRRRPI